MKVLLIKRLESSFHAFRNTVDRFIKTHETFLNEMDKGNVYVGKKNTRKLFEHLDKSDDDAVQKLLDDDKATRYPAEHFSPTLRETLQSDINTLKEIQSLWSGLERDPKLDRLVEMLSNDTELGHKLIIFSESKETAQYLASELEKRFPGAAILFTGDSTPAAREKIIENFDGNVLDSKKRLSNPDNHRGPVRGCQPASLQRHNQLRYPLEPDPPDATRWAHKPN